MHSADIPLAKLHTGTGQAYVRWQGKMVYFGRFGTAEADKKYWVWRGELGHGAAGGITVLELINRYAMAGHWDRAQASRFNNVKDALRKIGDLSTNNYGPAVFKAHRTQIAATGTRSARQVNDLMRLVQRIFKWGVSESLVQYDVWATLKTVEPLKPYEVAKQTRPREAANEDDVIKTLPFLRDNSWSAIRLLMLTGARPSEVLSIRKDAIDKNGPHGTWVVRLNQHKTAYRGKRRFLILNQEAQYIIEAIENEGDPSPWIFPSRILVGQHLTETALRQAVGHACKAAGVKRWAPYQLRHLAATQIAADHGVEAAARILGHSDTRVTQIYTHEPTAEDIRRAS